MGRVDRPDHTVAPHSGPEDHPQPSIPCQRDPAAVIQPQAATRQETRGCRVSEATAIMRAAIELRFRLLPCLWCRFERAASHHEPTIRPTFYGDVVGLCQEHHREGGCGGARPQRRCGVKSIKNEIAVRP
jgi:hypothetical protein